MALWGMWGLALGFHQGYCPSGPGKGYRVGMLLRLFGGDNYATSSSNLQVVACLAGSPLFWLLG